MKTAGPSGFTGERALRTEITSNLNSYRRETDEALLNSFHESMTTLISKQDKNGIKKKLLKENIKYRGKILKQNTSNQNLTID